jgi:hypothetical protein
MQDYAEAVAAARSDHPDDQHVVPQFEGEREHVASVTCWCEPRLDRAPRPALGDGRIWIHERRPQA